MKNKEIEKALNRYRKRKQHKIKNWSELCNHEERGYIRDANNEIAFLRGTVQSIQSAFNAEELHSSFSVQKLREVILSQFNHIESLEDKLAASEQQLADAPTWGEWQDATEENLEKSRIGTYEFEPYFGETAIRMKCEFFDNLPWKSTMTESANSLIEEVYRRFRRLNYEPKPAREVEKTYFIDNHGSEYTVEDLAGDPGQDDTTRELARDLLAAQAELRELKGGSDNAESK